MQAVPHAMFAPVASNPAAVRRWAVRCSGCLSVAFVECTTSEAFSGHPVCDLCEGRVEIMGEVQGAAIGHTVTCAACDGRCTHAKGPSCDCPCGGANHGTGATVERFVAEGKAPRVRFVATDAARAIAAEWAAQRAEAAELVTRCRGQWFGRGLERGMREAATKRTAKSRAAAARKAMDRVVAILAGATR